jgi:hypothetical protein
LLRRGGQGFATGEPAFRPTAREFTPINPL